MIYKKAAKIKKYINKKQLKTPVQTVTKKHKINIKTCKPYNLLFTAISRA